MLPSDGKIIMCTKKPVIHFSHNCTCAKRNSQWASTYQRNLVPEFLQLYKNIANFNQQGLEKYSDHASKDYFRSTNHRNIESLRQLVLKKSRIQYLEARGAQRVKNSYLCSNCKENGHTIKKCTSKCSSCDVNVCCTHLCKKGNKWTKRCLEDQPSLE